MPSLPSLLLPSHCPPPPLSPPLLHCPHHCGCLSWSQSCIPCWGWRGGRVLRAMLASQWVGSGGLAFRVGVVPWQGLCMAGWQCWGLAFCVEVAPWQDLCVAGQHCGRPCMPCWDDVMVGLACGESVSWADLACSDGVVVVADLHVAKMEAARLVCSEAEVAAGTCKA